jgi:hypothetical protein
VVIPEEVDRRGDAQWRCDNKVVANAERYVVRELAGAMEGNGAGTRAELRVLPREPGARIQRLCLCGAEGRRAEQPCDHALEEEFVHEKSLDVATCLDAAARSTFTLET